MSTSPHDYLTRGMSPADKKEFIQLYAANTRVTERIVSLLQGRLANKIEESEAVEIYDSPNFLLKLADLAGYRRCLRDTIKVISPSDKRK